MGHNDSSGAMFLGFIGLCQTLLSIVIGRIAHDKGRPFWLGFFLAFVLGPIVGGGIVCLLRPSPHASVCTGKPGNNAIRPIHLISAGFWPHRVSFTALVRKLRLAVRTDALSLLAMVYCILTALAIFCDRPILWPFGPVDWGNTFGLFSADCIATAIVLRLLPSSRYNNHEDAEED